MTIGTLFTLFILPMFYTFIAHCNSTREAEAPSHGVPAPAE